jgi:hypothetical protein
VWQQDRRVALVRRRGRHDVGALHRLHHEERGTKREIDLLPAMADPKDLFGELAGRLAARERIKVASR